MAKGLRSSVKKANRSKLRSRVFGPVEEARAERLHAKLLETIQQPKPEPAKRSDMEIDSTEGLSSTQRFRYAHTNPRIADNTAQEAAKEDDYPKGSSFLTAKVPRALCDENIDTCTNTNKSPDPAQDHCDLRNFYFYMGLCSDLDGFTDDGDLKFAFDLPPCWLQDQGLTVTT